MAEQSISDVLTNLVDTQNVTRGLNQKSRIQKEDFLKLLFTQLKYQDFESSVDYKDLMSQLSILAEIEQSMNLRDAIDALSKSIARSNFFAASSIIDKNAYIWGDEISVQGGSVKSLPAFSLDIPAREVVVKIEAPGGVTVRTIRMTDVSPGKHKVEWDGKNDAGNPVSDGKYTFEVVAYDTDGNEFKADKFVFGKIDSVSMNGTDIMVSVGGTSYSFEKVSDVSKD